MKKKTRILRNLTGKFVFFKENFFDFLLKNILAKGDLVEVIQIITFHGQSYQKKIVSRLTDPMYTLKLYLSSQILKKIENF